MALKKKTLLHTIVPIATFFIVFLFWEIIVKSFELPKWLLPAPSNIFYSMVANFPAFWPHIWISFITIFTGFIMAIPIAITFSALVTNYVVVSAALTPYVLFLVTTPIITLVPLLMLWMGFGINPRILTVLIQAFAIINLNSCTGFLNVPTLRHELMDTFGATRVQRFFHVTLPTALPDVFTGLRLATIFSTTTCISAEYVGGNTGLGSQIIMYSQFLKTTESFACIFYVALIGLFFYQLVGVVQNLVIKWKI
jgi:NitT/TauT family transport system permease protein